ncbi:alpha/beta fold hydrolase [Halolamina sp.]|jgi:pimeloyl-ACP methyl ester carboxylesterase|uniref:alpha/beta fold hydrolase n=1 Tax=Halolamina sp. TaxID=1940283 RepID=UPI000223BF89|nr:alpha/beta hydrolase fold containing protein [halophilic archaeon DL31]
MPYASNDGVSLYYEADGGGKAILCCGDIGLGAWQWGWQHAALAGPYELLVGDTRGCGRSDDPPQDCTVETLASDAVELLREHNVRAAHVVGAGLGGMVALELARTTGRVRSLVLIGTALSGDGYDPEPLFADPNDSEALQESMTAAFSQEFIDAHPGPVSEMVEWRAAEDADTDSWAKQAAALEEFVIEKPYEITDPALVVHGSEDTLCAPAQGEQLAADLPKGDLYEVAAAGHLAHIEASKDVNDRILGFLDDG